MPKVPKHAIILGIAWMAIALIQFVFPSDGRSTTTVAASQAYVSPAEQTRSAHPLP